MPSSIPTPGSEVLPFDRLRVAASGKGNVESLLNVHAQDGRVVSSHSGSSLPSRVDDEGEMLPDRPRV